MVRGLVCGSFLPLLAAIAQGAPKMSPEFKAAWQGHVRKGQYAVVTTRGVPTTSLYGVDGRQADAYYSVDVKGGAWRTSQGLLDVNQVETDTLGVGEVMEIAGVSVKDGENRIDLRMVSVEAHKLRRADGREARELVSTNFKFFFPRALLTRDDLPRAMEYVETHLKVLATEADARAYAARVVSGRAADGVHGSTANGGKVEIRPGMTPPDVVDVLGKPTKETTYQSQSKWSYPGLTVIFENGRVKEVRF
jgi:hypothetical protein